MAYTSIRPGQTWLDTNGARIQAHGGSILYDHGVFYWYGENKERSTIGSGIWHWGVRMYSSTDLYNWVDEGVIIPPEPNDPSSPLHPASLMDRPHILYNQNTGKYVCWLKIMGKGNRQSETVLEADQLKGPYRIVRTGLQPLSMNGGDFDLAVAEDGKGYYYFERVHSEMICADLTDDYTNVTGYYSTHFPHTNPPYVREAPAHFCRRHKHYLFTSGTTGYFANPSEVAIADSFHGPFTVLGNPHRYDRSLTSFCSQICSVFQHPLKKDLYIALADRWMPDMMKDKAAFESGMAYRRAARAFEKEFNPESNAAGGVEPLDIPSAVDTSLSDYVWLPVTFEGNMAYLDWRDEWTIEEFE